MCRNDPEDKDGFEDDDGCPEPDNDQDGFLDAVDKCPLERETPNDYMDDDGCPDRMPISIAGPKIELAWQIRFEPGTAELTYSGKKVLERVATFLIDHEELTAIRIDAHTDDRGNQRKLHRLSRKRAEVVADTLDSMGVAYFRLYPRGFGPTTPLVSNDTEEGRKLNNRIEFSILERTDDGPTI